MDFFFLKRSNFFLVVTESISKEILNATIISFTSKIVTRKGCSSFQLNRHFLFLGERSTGNDSHYAENNKGDASCSLGRPPLVTAKVH
jgi:hypothetical protein